MNPTIHNAWYKLIEFRDELDKIFKIPLARHVYINLNYDVRRRLLPLHRGGHIEILNQTNLK